MGAPNPMGIAECAPTVKQVLRDVARGKSIPKCQLVSGVDSQATGSFVKARQVISTPPCPAGTQQGLDNVVYHSGRRTDSDSNSYQTQSNIDNGVGGITATVCVGGQQYASQDPQTTADGNAIPAQEWWENVVMITPITKWAFDTYVDNKLFSTNLLSE